jgi:hypothetical protein
MAIDKGLYQTPLGIEEEAMAQGFSPIEIEIEDPESVTIGIDGMPIVRIEEDDEEDDFADNLAEELDEGVLQKMASDLIEDFDSDIGARKDWMQT